MKFFTISLIAILALVSVVLIITSFNENEVSESNQLSNTINESNPDKLIIGSISAPSVIIEYFDYKCPNCNNFHRTAYTKLKTDYIDTDIAKIEVRLTPVIGPDSATAARGAYCANDQNKFLDYHDTVLDFMWDNYYEDKNYSAEIENILTTELLAGLVENIVPDISEFKLCTNSEKYNNKLDENLLLAAEDGIRGTPGFTIGSQSFVGNQPFTVYKTLLDIGLDDER